ncbi:hypothetical protein PF007_g21736 [Phytophthora fragariae]|uniref:Secreted protein n=1 Tax=Phytophthora fragariae TaxID=53985 RepID=A0A6A3RJ22_9STRA|nr:hypothetical protein PF009_g23073 [Phytophthora fragariae]KAE9083864.1 hypothetical protein PF007_g21736 [Phytophthora fragariae]KAE9097283.1 hypothetical protein PF006_g23605 [Phytophthora fragariae]
MPAALLQLAAAAGGSAVTPLAASTLQMVPTVQYTPAVGALTRHVPGLVLACCLHPPLPRCLHPSTTFAVERHWWACQTALLTPSQSLTSLKKSWPDCVFLVVPTPNFSKQTRFGPSTSLTRTSVWLPSGRC